MYARLAKISLQNNWKYNKIESTLTRKFSLKDMYINCS